jgi:hypothetical protein
MTNKTVSAKWLEAAAAEVETAAKGSLESWIILGMADSYSRAMAEAATLRRAAGIKSISERRQFLRANGFDA